MIDYASYTTPCPFSPAPAPLAVVLHPHTKQIEAHPHHCRHHGQPPPAFEEQRGEALLEGAGGDERAGGRDDTGSWEVVRLVVGRIVSIWITCMQISK